MKYNQEKHHRRSVRLKRYDYSGPGAYFVTVCAWNRECIFGEIIDREMKLNEYGKIVHEYFEHIPGHFSNVEMDMHVVMPNHIHGIIMINHPCGGGKTPPLRKPTLGQIVAYFKYQTTGRINESRNTSYPVWQRNYFDRIIRNEHELYKIRKYIRDNPLKWDIDAENPKYI